MAFKLPSIPSLPTISLPKVVSFVKSPAAVLNVVSLIARQLPKLNPPRPIYAVVNTDTQIPLTIPDSWGEITLLMAEYQVSDYPVEAGEFAVYNKVRRPATVSVTMLKEGSDLERATWLEAIRQQLASDPTARYNILSPEGIFPNQTLVGMAQQKRSDRGSNLLYLELKFSEVPQMLQPSLVGAFAVDPTSGPMNSVGRVFSSETTPAVAALATANAPVGSALGALGQGG